MINAYISELISYAENTYLLDPADRTWAANRIIDILGLDSFENVIDHYDRGLEDILADILDWAEAHGVIGGGVTERDLLDTRLMGILTPRPSEVRAQFARLYKESPRKATDWYYTFSRDTDYIRTYRVARDLRWVTDTPYGALDISINLSKPEKDPRAIAAAKNAPQRGYPKCQLCAENEGYAGRMDHPARQNHRIIPITMGGQNWYFQYSPYVYYNEHCIAFSGEHRPMKIDRSCFRKMLDFIRIFPHYFIGSNADLPIVGGSILSHDHFQGGRYSFAMERAGVELPLSFPGFEDIEAGIVRWPMSVIRLRCGDSSRLVELADRILAAWRAYSDPEAGIFAGTDGEPHNTVTPIARMREGKYELDLVLRNNLTTEEFPLGVFHPHPELHHIKKENIGIIEVMGLAILPARLKTELAALGEAMLSGADIDADEALAKHAPWAEELKAKYRFTSGNITEILQQEVGLVFARVLEHAGVYKCTAAGREAFLRFAKSVN